MKRMRACGDSSGARVRQEGLDVTLVDFNLSAPVSTSVRELAENIWNRHHKGAKPFKYTSDDPFKYDVQKRVPDVEKAKRVLGFSADTSLDRIPDEVMPWIEEQIKLGGI